MTTDLHKIEIPAWFRLAYQVAANLAVPGVGALASAGDRMELEPVYVGVQSPGEAVQLQIDTANRLVKHADSVGYVVGNGGLMSPGSHISSLEDAWIMFEVKSQEHEVLTSPHALLISEKTRMAFTTLARPNGKHYGFLSKRGDDMDARNIRWGLSLGAAVGVATQACAYVEVMKQAQQAHTTGYGMAARRAAFAVDTIWNRLDRRHELGGESARKVLGAAGLKTVGDKILVLEQQLRDCATILPHPEPELAEVKAFVTAEISAGDDGLALA